MFMAWTLCHFTCGCWFLHSIHLENYIECTKKHNNRLMGNEEPLHSKWLEQYRKEFMAFVKLTYFLYRFFFFSSQMLLFVLCCQFVVCKVSSFCSGKDRQCHEQCRSRKFMNLMKIDGRSHAIHKWPWNTLILHEFDAWLQFNRSKTCLCTCINRLGVYDWQPLFGAYYGLWWRFGMQQN